MKKSGFTYEARFGGSHEWFTPKWIFDALGMKFSLDPCHPRGVRTYVPAALAFDKQQDGLKQVWLGSVWLNPPYGRGIGAWMEKMAAHGDGIALVPARTDTKWFHAAAPAADALLFPKGRIDFIDGDRRRKNAGSHDQGAPSVMMAWGADGMAALQRFKKLHGGWYVEQRTDIP